jgi:hypothetical protein
MISSCVDVLMNFRRMPVFSFSKLSVEFINVSVLGKKTHTGQCVPTPSPVVILKLSRVVHFISSQNVGREVRYDP